MNPTGAKAAEKAVPLLRLKPEPLKPGIQAMKYYAKK